MNKMISDCQGIDEVIEFSKNVGASHKIYHHYTNIEGLVGMVKSGYMHLTRGNSLKINDQHEATMKGKCSEWNKTYISCFTFGGENMAMWGLYCLPWEDGVRISIPNAELNRWINDINVIYKIIGQEYQPLYDDFDLSVNDMIYIDNKGEKISMTNKGSLNISNNPKFNDIDKKPIMTGYIKNKAWSYEHEIRLLLKCKHEHNNIDIIAIKLPNYVINKMTITTGPYFNGTLKHKVSECLLNCDFVTEKSGFEKLVKYQSLCNMCLNKPFRKNNTDF